MVSQITELQIELEGKRAEIIRLNNTVRYWVQQTEEWKKRAEGAERRVIEREG